MSKPILVDDGIPVSDPFTGWGNYFTLTPPPTSGKPDSITVITKSEISVESGRNQSVSQVIIVWTVVVTPYTATFTGTSKTRAGNLPILKELDAAVVVPGGSASINSGAGSNLWRSI